MARSDMRNAETRRAQQEVVCLHDVAEGVKDMRERVELLQLRANASKSELMHSLDLAWISATRLACEAAEAIQTGKKS